MWDVVAYVFVASQHRSKMRELKEREGIKLRYFVQKYRNNKKKPTGEPVVSGFISAKCQILWRSILANEEASDMEDSDANLDDEDAGLLLGQLQHLMECNSIWR